MLPLAMPWVLVLLTLISAFLFLFKRWILGVLLLLVVVILNSWSECISFRLWQVTNKGDKEALKVMSFNISGTSADIQPKAEKLKKIIANYNPDVLFVAEISDKNKPILDSLLKDDYPYMAYTKGYAHGFYSKLPLDGWHKMEKDSIEHLGIYSCNIFFKNDTIALYGCHFASNNYTSKKLYVTPDSIRDREDLKTYLTDIRLASRLRLQESMCVRDSIRHTIHPILLMGDLNDVGGSPTLKELEEAGLSDAWWKGGFGYGATIHRPLPYRIDHIMYSDRVKLLHIEVVDSEGLSDHNALYAEFEI